jgi:hypothetical protein
MLARASVVPFLLLLPLLLAGCGGGGGADAPGTTAQAQSAPSPTPPKLVTLIGSRESKGLHWIIVGDGFTAGEQEDLRTSALALARAFLDTPELAQHASVWNVHLLQAVSLQSGVDDSTAQRSVDTAFDGALGCGSNARVACVDWARINAALLSQQAPQAQVAVILNTPQYLGSSNSSGIVISRHVDSRQVALHEMGHRVAGLADEYVDDVVAGEWLPLYFEGRFPNVTRVANAGQAPWRHWLDDSAKGVGMFEGAFYCANGFYRAKEDSLMRTLQAPLGEVNAEAWLRAHGLREVRVRHYVEQERPTARIEVAPTEMAHLFELRDELTAELRALGYTAILLDLEGYRRGKMNELRAKHTGQPLERVERAFDRDRYMSADEAKAYGIIDQIVTHRGEVVPESKQPTLTA